MFCTNKEKIKISENDKNVKTIRARISGRETVIYRLLRGYSPEYDGFIYSILLSLYEGDDLADEEYAFDVTRDTHDAYRILDLTVRNEIVPSSFYESFEFIVDKL